MPATTPSQDQSFRAFNRRDVEAILALMYPDVQWANGMEGGYVQNRDAVREYWRRQFEVVIPQLEVLELETDAEARTVARVRQVVHDLNGQLLMNAKLRHRFTLENGASDGVITRFDFFDSGEGD